MTFLFNIVEIEFKGVYYSNNFLILWGVRMKTLKGSKVAIIGAGAVGATIAFALSFQQLCSELVLIDVNVDKAQGEVLDISHGLPFLGHMDIHAGDYSDCVDCDVIIITAGIPRKPGETRLDLAKKNVTLAHTITNSIMKYYTKGIILVVSNPCDVITYMVQMWTGLPSNLVIGSGTNLDSARFRSILSEKLEVDVRNVHGYILGEHGETQFPAWSQTHIAGMSVEDYARSAGISFTEEDKADIAAETKSSGAQIIKLKGATYNGIAVSVSALIQSILKNEHTIRPVCSLLTGQYGIEGCSMNVPTVIGVNGVDKILEVELTESELASLKASAESIKAAIEGVKDL